MLSRSHVQLFVAAATVALTATLAAGKPSQAVTAPPPGCTSNGISVPCWQDGWGTLDRADGCYYIVESPQPAADDPAWDGHRLNTGVVYRQRCFGDIGGVLVWRQY